MDGAGCRQLQENANLASSRLDVLNATHRSLRVDVERDECDRPAASQSADACASTDESRFT